MTSAITWKAHTSTTRFATAFDEVTKKYEDDNDLRTEKIEEFLITEAVKIEVMSKTVITESKNPNKWDKHLAPWFTAKCATTRRELRRAQRQFGKSSLQTRRAMS